MIKMSYCEKRCDQKIMPFQLMHPCVRISDGTISFRNRFEQLKSTDHSIVGKNRNQFDRFDFWANIDRRNR